jgi:hypothetical protein
MGMYSKNLYKVVQYEGFTEVLKQIQVFYTVTLC